MSANEAPVKKKKPIGLIILGIVGLFIIIGIANGGKSPEGGSGSAPAKQAAQQTEQQSAAAEVQVDAVDLFSAYKANEVSADQEYKDKIIEVTGKVVEITKDPMTDDPIVRLASGQNDMNLTSVDCHFRPEHSDAISSITKGEVITLKGTGAGFNLGATVQLNYCEPVN